MRGVAKAVAAVSWIAAVGVLALVTWGWLDRQRAARALAVHMETGKAYGARRLEVVGTLPDELRESSGLAVSRTQPGVLWSHNDSGDSPTLYAIDSSGRLLATIPIANAAAQDWEDISSGPCPGPLAPPAGQACLYLADIGDNNRVRQDVTVYVVLEPLLTGAAEKPPAVAAQSFRFRYPDQPEDSEALAVLPNGDVTVVSKGRTGPIGFLRVSAAGLARALGSGEVLTAEYQGGTGIEPDQRISRLVTGAAVSPDGSTLAVRTYNEVFFFGAKAGQGGGGWRDLGRPCFLGDAEPQGEAIDYLDEKILLLTSERARGRPGAIHRLEC